MPKHLRVAMTVPSDKIHNVLTVLQHLRVGDVEIHAIPELVPKAPNGALPKGRGKELVVKAIADGRKFRVSELAKELGLRKDSVGSQITRFLDEGMVRRVSPGLYIRTPKLGDLT